MNKKSEVSQMQAWFIPVTTVQFNENCILANVMKMAQFLAQHLFQAKVEYPVYQRKDSF